MKADRIGWGLDRLGWALLGKERRRGKKKRLRLVRVLTLTGNLGQQLLQQVDNLRHVPTSGLLAARKLLALLSRGKTWIGSMEGVGRECSMGKAMKLVKMRH